MVLTRASLVGIALFATLIGLAGWGVSRSLRVARAQAEAQAPKTAASAAAATEEKQTVPTESQPTSVQPTVNKTEAEWKSVLTDMQYYVTRQKGTERAYSGEYVHTKTPGTYKCVCCGEPLFTSGEKFDSHCGWPSFYQPIGGLKDTWVAEHRDTTHGMIRTEVTCRKCGAHLGHVFEDSPQTPTGLRYCINSASLKLEPKTEGEQPKADPAVETPAKPK